MRNLSKLVLAMVLFNSCSQHFISDRSFLKAVESDLNDRSEIIEAAGIDLEAMNLDSQELEALEFLYAYMPLGDIMNNSPEFYRECFDCTRKAVEEMPWGKTVPERELRHFVLPPRVNNENLDGCRPVFYEELAPRIKDLSMADAVLEVNHWCHKKATYKPSDSRTSAPLATVRTAYGRCGEESTFLVAALRSVGIPARQVYTPRWAHTDDNHAWVEAWVDGEWHFLGACEPEAVLDLGWFNAPASRGMLMSTNVFGRYDGPEEKLEETPLYTRINVVTNYAPDPRKLGVSVTYPDGSPAAGALVEYKIYNYGEFYSAATLAADENGHSCITVGNGDMLVYASDESGRFGFAKSAAGDGGTLGIVLEHDADTEIPSVALSVAPPPEKPALPDVSEEAKKANAERLTEENNIRTSYTETFRTKEQAAAFASANGLDEAKTVKVLTGSCGNYAEIEDFLVYAVSKGRGETALRMLGMVSDKDLRDTPSSVLKDHLDNCADDAEDGVLCPRISTELLRPWRSALQQKMGGSLAEMIRRNPAEFVQWCADSLTIYEGINNDYTAMDPVRVWESRIADKASRELFFVAACRSFGTEAWIDWVNGAVRYVFAGKEYDVDFGAADQTEPEFGTLILKYTPSFGVDNPKYYVNFSISAFDGRTFTQLNYGESDTWKSTFEKGTKLQPGLYVLSTGVRLASGEVCSEISFFTIRNGETTETELKLNFETEEVRVIGSFDSESFYSKDGSQTSILSTTGRGYYCLALVDGGSEPTVHAFKDIEAVAGKFEEWGRPVLVIFASEEDFTRFNPEQYNLPSTVSYGIDSTGEIRRQIEAEMKLNKASLPYVMIADTFNRIVFFSQGYTIGLGEQIISTADKL